MTRNKAPRLWTPQCRCRAAVARLDITPGRPVPVTTLTNDWQPGYIPPRRPTDRGSIRK